MLLACVAFRGAPLQEAARLLRLSSAAPLQLRRGGPFALPLLLAVALALALVPLLRFLGGGSEPTPVLLRAAGCNATCQLSSTAASFSRTLLPAG